MPPDDRPRPFAAIHLRSERLRHQAMELAKRGFEEGVEFMSGFREFFQRVRSDYQTCIATSMPEELLAIV